MITLYAVTREGIYRHEILGVFEKKDDAIFCAEGAYKEENDKYHSYHVLEFPLNKNVDDGGVIFSIKGGMGIL